MADKETLINEISELKTQLLPQLERDKAKFAAEGRPFDSVGWAAGKPDDHKYPAGPAFLVCNEIIYPIKSRDNETIIFCFSLMVLLFFIIYIINIIYFFSFFFNRFELIV